MRQFTRRWHGRSAAIVVLGLCLAQSGAALAHPSSNTPGAGTCDAATMRGVYAVQWTGTMLNQPLAVVGHVAFQGGGRVSGVLTELWQGQPLRYPFAGSYSLDADCRGELSFRAEGPLLPHQRTLEFHPSAGGRRASFILTGAQVEGVPLDGEQPLANLTIVLNGAGERLSATPMRCDQETVRGAYTVHSATMSSPVFGTMAVAGRANFDGERAISVRFTTASSAAMDRDSRYTGTYSATHDCRGEIRMNGLDHPHFGVADYHLADFYLAARGRRIFYILTKAWVVEVVGVGVDPLGINEKLAQGNEGEANFTHTGILVRR